MDGYSGRFDIIRITTPSGEIVDEWEDDPKYNCSREYCGGCNRCLEMQYVHGGMVSEKLRVKKILNELMPSE